MRTQQQSPWSRVGQDVQEIGYVSTVTRAPVNLRGGPGTNYPVIGQLPEGAVFHVGRTARGALRRASEATGEWVYGFTRTAGGLPSGGWVWGPFLREISVTYKGAPQLPLAPPQLAVVDPRTRVPGAFDLPVRAPSPPPFAPFAPPVAVVRPAGAPARLIRL